MKLGRAKTEGKKVMKTLKGILDWNERLRRRIKKLLFPYWMEILVFVSYVFATDICIAYKRIDDLSGEAAWSRYALPILGVLALGTLIQLLLKIQWVRKNKYFPVEAFILKSEIEKVGGGGLGEKAEKKPPLGLTRWEFHLEARLTEIYKAIARFEASGIEVPKIWLEEEENILQQLNNLKNRWYLKGRPG